MDILITNRKLYFRINNSQEHHYNHQYFDGLNYLSGEFNTSGSCTSGRLYFVDVDHIHDYFDYGIYLRDVYVPTENPDFRMIRVGSNKYGANMLFLSTKRCLSDFETYKYMIFKGGCMEKIIEKGICWAIKNDKLELVQQLFDIHPKVNTDSIISLAAGLGKIDFVSTLVNLGANKEIALISACISGQYRVVEQMILMGADIHVRYNYAVRAACWFEYMDIISLLVSHGANVRDYGDDAFITCVKNGCLKSVKYLISIGVDIHISYDLVLYKAVSNGDYQMVEYFLANGTYPKYILESALKCIYNKQYSNYNPDTAKIYNLLMNKINQSTLIEPVNIGSNLSIVSP